MAQSHPQQWLRLPPPSIVFVPRVPRKPLRKYMGDRSGNGVGKTWYNIFGQSMAKTYADSESASASRSRKAEGQSKARNQESKTKQNGKKTQINNPPKKTSGQAEVRSRRAKAEKGKKEKQKAKNEKRRRRRGRKTENQKQTSREARKQPIKKAEQLKKQRRKEAEKQRSKETKKQKSNKANKPQNIPKRYQKQKNNGASKQNGEKKKQQNWTTMRPSVVQIHASCSIPRALLKRHCSRPSGICIFWGSHQTDPTGPQPSRLWSLCDVTVSTLCPPPGSLGSKDRCRDVTFYRKTPIFGHLKHCVPLGCICEISLWGIPAHPASFVPN